MIKWLHISDLHMKHAPNADQQNSCDALLSDCRNQTIQADFVVVTGDFHIFGDREGYSATINYLCELMDALDLSIEEDLFIIPGNHDIAKDPNKSRRSIVDEFLAKATTNAKTANISEYEFDKTRDYVSALAKSPEILDRLMEDFQEYRTMASALVSIYKQSNSKKIDPASVHVRTWHNMINLLHLNTAILSDGNRAHAEAVDINTACGEAIRLSLNNGLPTLVLGHHSFHDLHKTIKDRLVQLFNQTNVWAYLAGDKHLSNYQGDDYLIDRKVLISAWPNIVARTLAAGLNDNYSSIGVIEYCWDEQSTVIPIHLTWVPESSGTGFTKLSRDAIRPFPMTAGVNCQLYFDLYERLTDIRNNHPSFQLMEIDEDLFPHARLELGFLPTVVTDIGGEEKNSELVQLLRESWSSEIQNHIMLEGEGGIGKTVALLSLISDEKYFSHQIPAIYIPLYALKESSDGISDYILENTLYGNRNQYNELKVLANRKWENGPRLVLLLDGFNEIAVADRYMVARNIEEWSCKRGIQVMITSRFDARPFLPGLHGQTNTFKLQPLTRESIQGHLNKAKLPLPSEDSLLWDVINFPLMLAIYTQTENVRNMRSAVPVDWRTANNAGTILWNYLQRELWRCQSQTRDALAPLWCVLATEYIAPQVSWEMVQEQRFGVPEDTFAKKIKSALTRLDNTAKTSLPPHIQKMMRHSGGLRIKPDADEMFHLLTGELNLFRIQNSVHGPIIQLMHQRFRDCLAAIHLLNLVYEMQESRVLPEAWHYSIDYYVMNFVAELATPSEADTLWDANRTRLPTSPDATMNMLDLQSRIRNNDLSKLNFSNMDLSKVNLHSYRLPGRTQLNLPHEAILLKNTKVSTETFITEGHSNAVCAIAITPDNSRCISASWDNTLRIWDINTGNCIHVLRGHIESVYAVAITPDGSRCVSASRDSTLRIWDVKTGVCLHLLNEHSDSVFGVAITPDGKRCISTSADNTLRIWDIDSGNCIWALEGHTEPVYAAAIISDGHRCVSASRDNTLRIWDIETGVCVHTLKGHSDRVADVVITPDEKYCVSASRDGTLRIWDIEAGVCIHTLKGHSAFVIAVAITPDGRRCVSASLDKTLRVWDMNTGDCLQVLEGHLSEVETVIITPDDSRCISASFDKTLRIWDLDSGNCLYTLKGHSESVVSVSITSDNKYCVSASYDATIRVWDMHTGMCLRILEGHTGGISNLSIISDNGQFISASLDNIIRIWDTNTNMCLQTLGGHSSHILSLAVTPDFQQCISSSEDNTLRIWNIKTGKCTVLNGHSLPVTAIAIASDSHRFVSVSRDGSIIVWDMNTNKHCIPPLRGHLDSIYAVSISPSEKYCVSASRDCSLKVWDMNTGDCIHTLKGHSTPVLAVAITSDGNYCVSAADCSLIVWDMNTGKCIHTLEGHSESVEAVCIMQDGNRCISASRDRSLRIWDIHTGDCLLSLVGHLDTVYSVAILPDGKRCASVSRDNTIRIWNMETGDCLHILNEHSGSISDISIFPGGERCISSSLDNTMRIWDINSGTCIDVLRPISGLSLFEVNLSAATIVPSEFAKVLRQNGAVTSIDA